MCTETEASISRFREEFTTRCWRKVRPKSTVGYLTPGGLLLEFDAKLTSLTP